MTAERVEERLEQRQHGGVEETDVGAFAPHGALGRLGSGARGLLAAVVLASQGPSFAFTAAGVLGLAGAVLTRHQSRPGMPRREPRVTAHAGVAPDFG
ncbi:hypothetical protein [Lentzea sp. HUAS12]|uniref:hypothetical protein n=1 Tax=Lentzea sp. HUAS12 TaxID=2951806 RepID=UPI00209E4BC2|nr:hypothetical protein [Lentzea sp. HUAS12]USX53098.1 hypothetical protein ND450_03085 [Lentzea sp. HUAS12]